MSEIFPKLTIAEQRESQSIVTLEYPLKTVKKEDTFISLWTYFLNLKSTLEGKIESAKRAAIVLNKQHIIYHLL